MTRCVLIEKSKLFLVIPKTLSVIRYPYNYLVSYPLSLKLFCQLSLIPKTPNRASLFRPLFSLEAAVSVFASTSSTSISLNNSLKQSHKYQNLAFHHQGLFGLHSCVIFNTFRFQSTHFMVTKTINLRGISNYPRQNYLQY